MLMIVRYSKPIRFPSGNCSNIQCISGEPGEGGEDRRRERRQSGADRIRRRQKDEVV